MLSAGERSVGADVKLSCVKLHFTGAWRRYSMYYDDARSMLTTMTNNSADDAVKGRYAVLEIQEMVTDAKTASRLE